MEKKIIFFDVETNGYQGSSVLSISAMKVLYNTETFEMIKLGEFDRFYYRNEGEAINEDAIRINGLTDEVISHKRSESGIEYAKTFLEDISEFKSFCEDARHYVAHNINFDRSFIPFYLDVQFDTMLENVQVLKLVGRYNKYKWPKLMECADFYGVKYSEDELHASMYDVLVMGRIFHKMNISKNEEIRNKIKRFIIDDISSL